MSRTSATMPRSCTPSDRLRSIPIGNCDAGAEHANSSAARRTRCSTVWGRRARTRDIVAPVIGSVRPRLKAAGLAASRRGPQLGQALGDALAALRQALLELAERGAAIADQRELAVEVPGGVVEQALALGRLGRAAVPLADEGPRLLGLDEPAELVEREVEQLLELEDLAQPLDVGLGVAAVLAVGALLGARQQGDLLVVAHGSHGGLGALGPLADAHGPVAHAASSRTCAGRRRQTTAPTTEVAASTHSAVCMFEMNG